MLRDFDAQDGWSNGFLSCAHWLHWRTGIDLGAAREKVRVAKALADLPLVSASLQRGEVSYAKVRALTRVATPANEAQLLDVAWAGTAAHVEPGDGVEDSHAVLEVGDNVAGVSAETYRRLACDASVVTMRHDAAGVSAADVSQWPG